MDVNNEEVIIEEEPVAKIETLAVTSADEGNAVLGADLEQLESEFPKQEEIMDAYKQEAFETRAMDLVLEEANNTATSEEVVEEPKKEKKSLFGGKKEKVKKEKKEKVKKEKPEKEVEVEEEQPKGKKKKKSFAWFFELFFLLAMLGCYAAVVYGGFDGIMKIGVFALGIFMAIIDLFVIFNTK